MLTFAMSIICVAGSYAQPEHKSKMTPEERAAKRVEMMKKSLNLTDEQTAKLQEAQMQLFNDMRQIRGIRERGEAKRGEMTAEMRAKREEMKAEMQAKREEIQAKRGEMTAEMQAKHEEMKVKAEAMKVEMKAKKDAYEAKLKTILTSDQYKKYQEQSKEMQKNKHKRMQNGQKPHGERTKGEVKK